MKLAVDVKDSVRFKQLRLEIMWAIKIVGIIWKAHGLTPTITSANDSKHMVKSLHYKDRAIDIRLKDVEVSLRPTLVQLVAHALGDEYDVLHEFVDDPVNVHMHVEWDPGDPAS